MVNLKKVSLGLIATFSLLFVLAITCADDPVSITLTPNSGKVSDIITVIGTGFSNSTTVDITFAGVNAGNTSVSSTGTFSTEITIPTKTAGTYEVKAQGNNVSEHNANNFTLLNSAPIIRTTSIDDAYVGSAYSKKIELADLNGNTTLSSCSLNNGGLTRLQLYSSTPTQESGVYYCKLLFSGDGKPTSSDVGKYDLTLTVSDGTDNKTQDYAINVLDYIEITDIEINDQTGDDDDHMPGDTIEIKVTVKNLIDATALNLDDEILNDIKITIENDDLELDEDSPKFDLKDKNDKSTQTLSFEIPYSTHEGTYDIKITAVGDDDDGIEHIAEATKVLKVTRENHKIIITDLGFKEDKSTCGDTIALNFTVINIGSSNEEDISISISADALNLNSVLEKFDLKEGKKALKETTFNIPDKAYDNTFRFQIKATYDDGDETVTEYLDLKVEGCKSKFIEVGLASNVINVGDKTKLTVTLENIGSISKNFEIKLIGVDKFGTYNASDDLASMDVEAGGSKSTDIDLTANADAAEGLYEIKVEIYSGNTLIGSKSTGLTLESAGLLAGFAVFRDDAGQTSLIIGIILVLALITYLGYQLWFKGKDWSSFGKEKENKGKDEDDDIRSLIFEDENPMAPDNKKKK